MPMTVLTLILPTLAPREANQLGTRLDADNQAQPVKWWKEEIAKNPRQEKDKTKVAFDLVEVHFGF